jgi:hypothetical protein
LQIRIAYSRIIWRWHFVFSDPRYLPIFLWFKFYIKKAKDLLSCNSALNNQGPIPTMPIFTALMILLVQSMLKLEAIFSRFVHREL